MRRTLAGKSLTKAGRAAYLLMEMHASFPNATLTGHEPLIDAITNDAKDRHVLAAEILATLARLTPRFAAAMRERLPTT